MRADYFRLCFIAMVGGFYVDADDAYLGHPVDALMNGRLMLQPLCYDVLTDSMLNPAISAATSAGEARTFYVNNNPLIAPPGHPVIVRALERSTALVLAAGKNARDIQALTGPGNLTTCLVAHAIEIDRANSEKDFELVPDWESVAISKWPLAYRSDARNWRNWVHCDV
jgi:hypothetical protein